MPIGILAPDGRVLDANPALLALLGYTRAEMLQVNVEELTHPEDREPGATLFQELQAGGRDSYQIEKRYRHAWGHYVWMLVTASIVRDSDRNPLYVVTQAQEISDQKELARRLEYFVDHDFLTGLFNRRHFEQELATETERAARYGSPGAVLLTTA